MYLASSCGRGVDLRGHLAGHRRVGMHHLHAGEEQHRQLGHRGEEVLDVVLAAVVAEVLADDERELLRLEAR